MNKKILSMLAVAGVAITLAGCSATASSGSKQQTLNVWDMQQSGKDINAAYAPIIKSFEAANPGITVKLTVFPYEQYQSKALLAMKGGTGPDVLSLDQIWTAQFAAAKLVSPIDSQLAGSKDIKKADFFPGAWASNEYAGKTWGVPLNADVWEQMYYNADLFRAAGLDPDKPPTTWTEWNADAAKLTDKANDQYGMSLIGCKNEAAVVLSNSLLFSNGGSIISGDKSKYDSAANIAGLKQYATLASYAPPGVAAVCEQDAVSRFTAGKAAMLLDGSWQQDTMKTAAKFDWRIATPPSPAGKTFVGALGGFNLAVSAKSKDSALAFKWIQAVSQPKNQIAVNSLIPALKAAGSTFVKANRKQPSVVLDTLEHGSARPLTPVYPLISQAQQDAVQAILGGEAPDKAAKDASTSITSAINGN